MSFIYLPLVTFIKKLYQMFNSKMKITDYKIKNSDTGLFTKERKT